MFDIIWYGIVTGLILSISVGPVIFAIIKYSLKQGYKAGISFVFGVSFSDIIWVALTIWASTFLSKLTAYYNIISIVGAALLIVLGLLGFFKKENIFALRNNNFSVTKTNYYSIWLSGFALNVFNPGAIIMWLGIGAQISALEFTTKNKIIFFTALLSCILLSDLLKVFLASLLRKKLTVRNIYYLNKTSSLLLIALGLAMIIKTLFFK